MFRRKKKQKQKTKIRKEIDKIPIGKSVKSHDHAFSRRETINAQ